MATIRSYCTLSLDTFDNRTRLLLSAKLFSLLPLCIPTLCTLDTIRFLCAHTLFHDFSVFPFWYIWFSFSQLRALFEPFSGSVSLRSFSLFETRRSLGYPTFSFYKHCLEHRTGRQTLRTICMILALTWWYANFRKWFYKKNILTVPFPRRCEIEKLK